MSQATTIKLLSVAAVIALAGAYTRFHEVSRENAAIADANAKAAAVEITAPITEASSGPTTSIDLPPNDLAACRAFNLALLDIVKQGNGTTPTTSLEYGLAKLDAIDAVARAASPDVRDKIYAADQAIRQSEIDNKLVDSFKTDVNTAQTACATELLEPASVANAG